MSTRKDLRFPINRNSVSSKPLSRAYPTGEIMVRLFILSAALVVCSASSAQAKIFGGLFKGFRNKSVTKVPNNYRTPYPTTASGGMSIGVFSYPNYNYPRPGQFDPYRFDNYVHDPYIRGSFEMPDLAKDPYFRERHRYDSHFPGRRYRNTPRH